MANDLNIIRNFIKEKIQNGLKVSSQNGKLIIKGNLAALSDEDKQFFKQNKESIISVVSQLSNTRAKLKPHTCPKDRIPLSFSQQRLWFLDKVQGGGVEYNVPLVYKITGSLDLASVKKALQSILERHEVLRTVYIETEQSLVYQKVCDNTKVDIEQHDLTEVAEDQKQSLVKNIITKSAAKPFNLSSDLMLRCLYIHTSKATDTQPSSGVLFFNIHHIASDGWSMNVMSREFITFYQAYTAGESADLPALQFQYADYACWQREWLDGKVLESQLSYWQKKLDDAPALHGIATRNTRPKVKQSAGKTVSETLPLDIASTLQKIANDFQLTPFMLIHATLALVISKHSNSQDIVIGTPVANRLVAGLEPLIGFFVNSLPLRLNTNHTNLAAYFEHVREVHLGAQSNQDVPFDQLVEHLKLERSTSHSPLIQIMLTTMTDYKLQSDVNYELPGVDIEPLSLAESTSKFDMDIDVSFTMNGLCIDWTYDEALFGESQVQLLVQHLCNVLSAISELGEQSSGQVALANIAILSDNEIDKLLDKAAGPKIARETPQCLHQIFEQQTKLTPDACAVITAQGATSYRELNHKANLIAHRIKTYTKEMTNPLIGLYIERSVEMIAGLLGILKAGCGYLALDIKHSDKIIVERVQDANVGLILSNSANAQALSDTANIDVIHLDKINWEQEVSDLNISVDQQALAYALTTSGSTGKPKLIGMHHKPLVNLIYAMQENCQEIAKPHTVLQFSSIGFDMSFTDIFLALLQGGSLQLVTETEQFDVEEIATKLHAANISLANLPYSMLQTLASYSNEKQLQFPSLEVVISTAALLVITPEIRTFFKRHPNIRLVNQYGPSETHVCTSTVLTSEVDEWPESIAIGAPITNTHCYVVDHNGKLVPDGAIGELFIGGECVGKGYLNNTALTEQSFIPNTFPGDTSPLLYRSGDLVRWLANGELEYIGRKDEQVKIRGFRIEIGAIESQITNCDKIAKTCVIAIEDREMLVAYILPKEPIEISELKAELSQKLPEYMIPNRFVVVENWPLTTNGKTDKKRLPAYDDVIDDEHALPPETITEHALAAIWAELLGVPKDSIGQESSFFSLGGHSLLAVRLTSEIRTQLDCEVAIKDVFQSPTLTALANIIDTQSNRVERPPIIPVERTGKYLPLSYSQQRLWFLDSLQGGTPEYNMPIIFELHGDINLALLNLVFQTIVDRHEVLRTNFVNTDGEVTQHIKRSENAPFAIKVIDLTTTDGTDQTAQIQQLVEQEVRTPFDLAHDLMLRAKYIKTSEGEGVLTVNMHHIASDGWSLEIFTNEFITLYNAFHSGQANPLPALDIQYADYAHWQRSYLTEEMLESQLAYWQQQLADLPEVHNLPTQYPRPNIKQYEGDIVKLSLPEHAAQQLQTMAKKHGVTQFMLCHGIFALLLARYSGTNDIVIGVPVANRLHTEVDNLIGMFINNLVLRLDVEQGSIAKYLQHVKNTHLAAQENQDVPFEQLVESLNVARSTSHAPVFQIMMTTNTEYGITSSEEDFTLPDIELKPYSSNVIHEKYDLHVDFRITNDGVDLSCTFDCHLFDKAFITQFMSHLEQMVFAVSALPSVTDQQLCPSKLPMLSKEETGFLLNALNDTASDYPTDLCIHELFEHQATVHHDNIAIVFENEQLTYGELNARANQLAHCLVAQYDVKPDTLVGLCIERSLEMVIGILAILKAGGAYVPLDPSYPQARLSYMLDDASLDVVLSANSTSVVLGEIYNGRIIDIKNNVHFAQFPTTNVNLTAQGLTSSHLAYVIYTSGSTGKPKGVMVEHQALVNRIHWMQTQYNMTVDDTVLQKTPYSFDVSVWEFVWPLSYGGRLVIAKPEGHKDSAYLCDLIQRSAITKLHFVPSMLGAMLENEAFKLCTNLKQVFCSGEALQVSHVEGVRQALPNTELHNLYGPTEAAIDVSYWNCSGDISHGVPIGKPIDNIQLMVLDKFLNMTPHGVAGELFIGGTGLARGYLNRPELTTERFIDNPYFDAGSPNSSKRLYRTGDLVRYLSDGNLEFIARIDHQVKIRGFRIELGEIEAQLSQQPRVESSLVVATELAGSQQLVAYVKPTDTLSEAEQSNYISGLKSALNSVLPDYMVPSVLMIVDEWPLTPNGKLDRKALAQPQQSIEVEYVAPQTDTERTLAKIWAELLKIEAHQISIHNGFFELGGHSILVIRLLSRIEQELGLKLDLQGLYEVSELRELAQICDSLKLNLNAQDKLNELEETEFEDVEF
ncbi:non-ribosomal peptide synthetase [Pseudoalteromonas luteoviolacea]|uniref:Amino acid adenylation domain/amino acid adenylation domain protein n=1 Tax=Pseudoalteromonas luteoviolacea (strain 2ta16) TaxID=1353533 RepID=V4H8Y8_PSEL2|nr:non-ribosomal peptide synthetase [Pseudoalteromonas luteoviolacea]ESP93916.1 amino acid adenylation domain/amino acid adenylation domain protein [Pseudoalteromonas luteoviolacea 2ta16]KZN31349.1 hypothetical protein N483_05870 [Pseudoalteromonas luteoviolacea NCIMB 1944]